MRTKNGEMGKQENVVTNSLNHTKKYGIRRYFKHQRV